MIALYILFISNIQCDMVSFPFSYSEIIQPRLEISFPLENATLKEILIPIFLILFSKNLITLDFIYLKSTELQLNYYTTINVLFIIITLILII